MPAFRNSAKGRRSGHSNMGTSRLSPYLPDPAGDGWNAYAYGTNPNSGTDPEGLLWMSGDLTLAETPDAPDPATDHTQDTCKSAVGDNCAPTQDQAQNPQKVDPGCPDANCVTATASALPPVKPLGQQDDIGFGTLLGLLFLPGRLLNDAIYNPPTNCHCNTRLA